MKVYLDDERGFETVYELHKPDDIEVIEEFPEQEEVTTDYSPLLDSYAILSDALVQGGRDTYMATQSLYKKYRVMNRLRQKRTSVSGVFKTA